MTISNSTFSSNTGNAECGAIQSRRSTTSIINSTFAGNSTFGVGGAIADDDQTVKVVNSTFFGNAASANGGGVAWNSDSLPATTTFKSSILFSNGATGGNCALTITDGGYNLDDDGTCGFSSGTTPDSSIALDPTGLQNNGGPTETIALTSNTSVAVDKIPKSSCTDLASGNPITTDQRGDQRPDPEDRLAGKLGSCDIGAYEFQDPGPLDPFSVNYFIHAHTLGPDDTMRIVDPGTWMESDNLPVCADIYVFDAAQEMEECCSCVITPAGRLDFSLNKNLTSTPVTGGVLTTGTIKIVKTLQTLPGHTCSAASGGAPFIGTAFVSWLTHDVNQFNSNKNAVEEAEFQSTHEPASDITILQDKCETTLNTGAAHGTGACTCPNPVIP